MDAPLPRPSTSLGDVERFFQLSLLGDARLGLDRRGQFRVPCLAGSSHHPIGVRGPCRQDRPLDETGLGPRAASIPTIACFVFYPMREV
jgi:hypothetical protein